ncbi:MAG: Outer membrane efflux protein BepC [Alphaproteobacteria bacterium MarineAlpha5_Bin12]|nr:MAG: Outer membrane efflux protein BepC [Alphaproteobacteria bacterium MarineAlpha5_Bin12]|tara:strand:+ start:38 stop:1324 length:1287 start_codon:yes stop_codon:yes gene_type:complete
MKKYFTTIIFIFLFNSNNIYALDIAETIKNTVENNLKVKIGLEEINESKELIARAYGNFKPDINLTLTEKQSSTETKTGGSTTTTDKLSDTYSLTVKQNLYNGGRNNLELKKSLLLFDKQLENFNFTLNELILSAIRGYLTVKLYEKSLEVTEKNFEVIKKINDDAKKKYDLGVSTLSDLKNAESSFQDANTNLMIAKGDLKIGKETFKQIVGLDPIDLQDLVKFNNNKNKDDIFNTALINNHEINSLKFDIEISKIDLEIYKKVKLPSLDITGDLSYNDDVSAKGTESTSGSISAQLSIPIFQKGIENSDIRKFQSKLLQNEFKLNDKINDIDLQASILSNNYQIYQSQLIASNSKIESNSITLNVIKQEYESGIKTFTDLINQEELLLQSYLSSFDINNNLLITYFEILALEGQLINEFSEFLPNI